MDRVFAETDEQLPSDWALQHPEDYIEVLRHAVPAAVEAAGIEPETVVGIGTDFTSCTILPARRDGTPLCQLDQFRARPHAYPMDRWVEAADWIVWQLCGEEVRSACPAGYKATYQDGRYPSKDYFRALNPQFADFAERKLGSVLAELGARADSLASEAAEWTGLNRGIAVAVGNVDAHVTAPAARATEPGQMVAVMGTSTCHVMVGDQLAEVPGMTELADQQRVGEHRLIALDWWNGNRSVLVDHDLRGVLIGMSLATRPEEIYRALIESTALGHARSSRHSAMQASRSPNSSPRAACSQTRC